MIYQTYNDPYGKWSDVSKEQYDDWPGEKRVIEVIATHFGHASKASARNVFEIVHSLTRDYIIKQPLGAIQHFEVQVPEQLVDVVRRTCSERLPDHLKIEVRARGIKWRC